MFTPVAINYARSLDTDPGQVPKGLNAKYDAQGELEILPEFEAGLQDIESFSHLMVV